MQSTTTTALSYKTHPTLNPTFLPDPPTFASFVKNISVSFVSMRLYVYVLEAKDLPVKDSYVNLQVGKHKSKTRILRNTIVPVWNDEFVFRVHGTDEELVVSVYHHVEEPKIFSGSGNLLGRIWIPLWSVAAEKNQTLPPTWFPLERPKTGKFINKECGKIFLTMSLHGISYETSVNHVLCAHSNNNIEEPKELEVSCISCQDIFSSKTPSRKIAEGKYLMKTIANRLEKIFHKNEEALRSDDSSELSSTLSDYEDCMEEHSSSCSFVEAIEMMQSRYNGQDKMPENLQGGILLDQLYIVSSHDLNAFLFSPDSQFSKNLAEVQGTKDVQEGPWMWKSGATSDLTRAVSYTKAATKLVKAVKATEEQTYIRADGREFVVSVSVSTPDVPYGSTFKVELLYKIMPGPELSSGEELSHLVVSWGINFLQKTMMRGMIEGGVRQGLKESFDQFASLLTQNFKIFDMVSVSNKDDVLETLGAEHRSDWQLATEYFWNLTVVSAIFMAMYFLVHSLLSEPSNLQGLEFKGLDLPDSLGELITSGILVIQLERVYNMISHFIQARLQRGSDHGVKAQGDGWVLTIALIEGINLASLVSTEFSDPYVVFTCNGKTRTSSVKLQTRDPQWNEMLEFDAMEEPPSVLDVEVFDFDGPFELATSLGHAEINFVKHTSTELADMWVPLEGKLAQSSQSKLHLRMFVDNNKGVEMIREYLTKMEKEVGKKLSLRSPQKNSTFQKLFILPPEEFLISDFTCHLKRKMPLQGRLFLSSRIVGFYANLFGHKAKFFFLWEDIEDIQVLPPSLASMGSPTLVIILRKDRGLDARHGAKSQDEEGRLKFYFQSFASFNGASRTLTPDQKAQISEEQEDQDDTSIMLEDAGSFPDVEDAKLSKVFTAELPININSLMEIFDGGKLEHKIMEKSGCLNYATTTWEPVKPDVFERRLSYKFNRHVSVFGGEVICTQQKFPIPNNEGWIVNEVMALQGVPFDDHFHVHFRYQMEKSHDHSDSSCMCDVYIGVTWLKSIKFQQRITWNITKKFAHRLKEIFEVVDTDREILFRTQQDS
ncbi:C2 and GRAM domain-containing protein At5g50170 isoform X3 [Carya illinoinensis]|uniref:C2 and GRAM domain-containing protein At5g50170 isoform X3 n=1 Tax=Carya illinoinensis TaxID=32201 RepID=UPI001C71833D|nr:C2 and GRAM domain-containing protein At5g50170 isoform X3 [Carya illinoinensis]